MKTITYTELKNLVEQDVGIPLNQDIFWNTAPVKVYPPKKEQIHTRLVLNLARKSHKKKPHKKDNGNTLMMNMVTNLIHRLQKKKVLELGAYEVVPS